MGAPPISPPHYVRFGDLPASGRSWNAADKRREAGVSVYAGRLAEPDLFIIYTSDLSVEGLGLLIAFAAVDRPALFVEGEEVGTGHDGEPLLKVARSWPVPRSYAIVPTDGIAQPALRLWSRGPRDNSGRKRLRQRLAPGGGYIPSSLTVDARAFERLHGVQPTKKPGEKRASHKRKQQTQARKKQRRKK
ncbi:MAG: hypothetical protein M3R38_38790 [Actinomycetota bacterium]|nr:hypothetical protein [Actinomycetota bacterium]